jgi:hypothetical protein
VRSLNLSSHQTPDWLGQQGGKALDWAGKQREQVINWGGDALNWAGRQGDELLRPLDDLLTGRNLEMAGVPRGAKPNINAPTPKPRPETPTSAPRPGETAPAKPPVAEETTPTNLPSSRSPDVDTPNGRTPDVETPNGGTPQVDAPNVRTPEVETPNARTPEVETPNARTPEVDTPNPTKVEPEPPAPRNADGTANIEQEVGEAGLRGADNVAGAGRVADDPEAMNVLADTAPKQRLSELSSKELRGELDVVEDLPRKQINEPPYVEEVELPNGHEWKRQQDGTWCRFSEPKGDNCLPPHAQELVDTVNKDAQDIIGGTASKNTRRDMAATARASSPEPGTMTSHFENIKPPVKTQNFPGFHIKDEVDGIFILTVPDPDKFMNSLKNIYEGQKTSLHPKLEEKIRNYVSGEGRTFSNRDGVPGLHAEVQAVNARLHQLTEDGVEITDEVFAQIQVATYRVTPNPPELEGKDFPACHNCTNILHDTNILTGVIEK